MKTTMIRWAAVVALASVSPCRRTRGRRRGRRACHPALPDPQAGADELSFAGPFGHYDRGQLQRGYQVYKEVCASCHAMSLVRFRNLGEPGGPEFSEAQVKAIAAEYTVTDGPGEDGEMFERPAEPKDAFPSPFANPQAARAANGGAYPPDLSLIAKARAVERGFPWFVLDIFTTYQETAPTTCTRSSPGTRIRRKAWSSPTGSTTTRTSSPVRRWPCRRRFRTSR